MRESITNKICSWQRCGLGSYDVEYDQLCQTCTHCDPDLLDAWERMNPEEQDYYSGDFSDKQKRE